MKAIVEKKMAAMGKKAAEQKKVAVEHKAAMVKRSAREGSDGRGKTDHSSRGVCGGKEEGGGVEEVAKEKKAVE